MEKLTTAKTVVKKIKGSSSGGKGSGKSQFSKEQVTKALRQAYGIKSQAAAMLVQKNGKTLTRQGLELLVDKYDLHNVVEECGESFVDLAEVAIAKKIKSGCTTSTLFTLKTKGAHRGWKEGPKANIVNNIEFDPSNLTKLHEYTDTDTE